MMKSRKNANFLQFELNSFSHDSYFALNLHLKLSKTRLVKNSRKALIFVKCVCIDAFFWPSSPLRVSSQSDPLDLGSMNSAFTTLGKLRLPNYVNPNPYVVHNVSWDNVGVTIKYT